MKIFLNKGVKSRVVSTRWLTFQVVLKRCLTFSVFLSKFVEGWRLVILSI